MVHVIVNALLFLAAALDLVLGLVVLLRNSQQQLNKRFFVLSAAMTGWVATNILFQLLNSTDGKYVVVFLSYGFASLLAVYLYLFTEKLTAHVGNPKLRAALLSFATFMGLVSLIPGVIGKSVSAKGVISTNGGLLAVYDFSLLILFVLSFWQVLSARARASGIEKARYSVIVYSLIAALVVGITCNLILPLSGTYTLVSVGPTGVLIFAAGTAYAVVRHQLFDIRLVVARSLAYVLLLSTIIAGYVLVVFSFATALLGAHMFFVQRLLPLALALFIAFTFQPTKRFFDKLTNRLFYRDAYDAQEVLDRAGGLMAGNVELDSLCQTVMALLGDTLHPQRLSVLIVSGEPLSISLHRQEFSAAQLSTLTAHLRGLSHAITVVDELDSHELKDAFQTLGVSLIIPLAAHDSPIGYILCGDKLNGSQYGRQDVRLLSIVADGLAIAVQNALRFEEIEHFNVTLQDKIEKATRELRRANQRLKALDESKDDFISMASHQLRTPLTSAKGYLSLVLDGDAGKITAAQRKLLTQAFTSSQRMVYLISDLLNVSRLKTGKFVIESSPVDLAEIVAGEVNQLAETATSRNLELTYAKPERFPTLPLDETKIRQVIMNFIDNAIYYTPSGGHIVVKLVDSPSSVEFTVNDDGIGVPGADRPHLFSKFYRAGNARKARPDGTGLGLFMARKVIAAQGGAIIFKSQEGKGSTFGFTFAKATLKTPASSPT